MSSTGLLPKDNVSRLSRSCLVLLPVVPSIARSQVTRTSGTSWLAIHGLSFEIERLMGRDDKPYPSPPLLMLAQCAECIHSIHHKRFV